MAVERLRHQRAQDAMQAALAECLPAWRQRLERATEKADAASLAAIERFQQAEATRAELRAALNWTQRPQGQPRRGGPVPSAMRRNVNSDERLSVDELVLAIRSGVENSTVAAGRARAEQRAADEAEAAQRLAQQRQWTEQAVR